MESSPEVLAVEGLAGTASATLGALQLTDSDFKVPHLRVNLPGQLVALEGLALNAKGKSGGDNVEVHLQAPKLDVSPERAQGESASLTVKVNGAQRNANIVLKLSGAEGSAKALKIAALTLDVDAQQQENAIKGTLTTPVTGNLESKLFELPKIVADFTVSGPTIPQKSMKVPLSGWVRADLGKEVGRRRSDHQVRSEQHQSEARRTEFQSDGVQLRCRHRPAERRQVSAAESRAVRRPAARSRRARRRPRKNRSICPR